MQAIFPFPRVTAEFVFHQAALCFAKETFAISVYLFGIFALLIMRSKSRLKPSARIVAGVVRIYAGRIAQRCRDGDLARNGARRKGNGRTNITCGRDGTLVNKWFIYVAVELPRNSQKKGAQAIIAAPFW